MGFFSKPEVGSGFRFDISLWDSNDKQTASDGQLVAALLELGSTPLYGTGPIAKYPYQHAITPAKPVKSEEFEWRTYNTTLGEVKRLTWIYVQTTPPVFFKYDCWLYLHIWFTCPDGKCLYKKASEWLYWKDD